MVYLQEGTPTIEGVSIWYEKVYVLVFGVVALFDVAVATAP